MFKFFEKKFIDNSSQNHFKTDEKLCLYKIGRSKAMKLVVGWIDAWVGGRKSNLIDYYSNQ